MSKKPIKIDYSPSDFLGGTILLDVYEELAYRRLCDLIYVMDGKLPDDKALADLTKTKKRWPKIRQRLLDLGKIEVKNGFILNSRCMLELGKKREQIEKARRGAEITNTRKKRDAGGAPPNAQRTQSGTQSARPRGSPTGSQPLTLNPLTESKTHIPSSETARDTEFNFIEIADEAFRRAGIHPDEQRDLGAADRHTVKAWLNAGAIPDRHVYPVIDAWMAERERSGKGPPDSLRYFAKGVDEARQNVPAKPNGANGHHGPEAYVPVAEQDRRLKLLRLKCWIDHGEKPEAWLAQWGDPPVLEDGSHNPRSDVSPELVAEARARAKSEPLDKSAGPAA